MKGKEKKSYKGAKTRAFSVTMLVVMTLSVFVGVLPAENVDTNVSVAQNVTDAEGITEESFTANVSQGNSRGVNVSGESSQNEISVEGSDTKEAIELPVTPGYKEDEDYRYYIINAKWKKIGFKVTIAESKKTGAKTIKSTSVGIWEFDINLPISGPPGVSYTLSLIPGVADLFTFIASGDYITILSGIL